MSFYWYAINDNEKHVGKTTVKGTILKAGRLLVRQLDTAHGAADAFWSFFSGLNWFEVSLKFGGASSRVSLALILPWLVHLGVGFNVPRRWLNGWVMFDYDRVFSLKLGYIGHILDLAFFYNEWAESGGMLSYYAGQKPRQHTPLELLRGWTLRVEVPPVLDWIFGRIQHVRDELERHDVKVPMDGREYPAIVVVEHRYRTRPRWPFAFGHSYGSWIDVENPPRFAGKGESSHDCGDDGIWGMGSRETRPASVVGQYVKRVLENRERYGMPSELRA